MNKIYQFQEAYDREFKSADYSCKYYSKRKMKAIYPDQGYIVIGAVGSGLHKEAGKFRVKEWEYPYYKQSYPRLSYGVDGYIDCGNDQFLAVVKHKLLQHLIVPVLLLLILAGVVFGGMKLLGGKLDLDPGIKDYDPKIEMPVNADPDRIAIPGYGDLTMLADTDELYVALWNPDTNPCYFKFTIMLEENEKILYESGLVPPGKAITTVKLKKKLSEGTYPVLVKMDTFSLNDGETPMNGGSSKAVINVTKK